VNFLQNHDQIGNRAFGERLSKLVGPDKLAQAMVLVLLNPHIPLLFMGEEAAIDTPFLFFADWSGEAADLTRAGRRREFAHFKAFSTPELREKIPDPCDERTFLASKLDWRAIERAPARVAFRALTRELLQIRHDRIVPLIKQGIVEAKADLIGADANGGLDARWQTGKGDVLQIIANFSDEELPTPTLIDGKTLWPPGMAKRDVLPPAGVMVRLDSHTNVP